MIDLSNATLLARGLNQSVFQHPLDPSSLIKVMASVAYDEKHVRGLRTEKRRFGAYRSWLEEYKYYVAAMNHSGGIPDYLPEIRGFTATSHGVGQVLEKITDDGSDEIAANLKQALEQGLVSKETAMDLARVLFDKFTRDKIVVRDFHAANLCLVRTNDGQARKLVLIDGLGEPTLIKARTILPILHKRWRAKALRRLNAECDSILSQPKA